MNIKNTTNDHLKMPDFWVYILYCINNRFYTGYTVELNRRYYTHVQGKGAKYTRSFRPLFLAQVWPIFGKKYQAMQVERFIKKLNKQEKERLIHSPLSLEILFGEHNL